MSVVTDVIAQAQQRMLAKIQQAEAAGDTKTIQKLGKIAAKHARSTDTSGFVANGWVDVAHAAGHTDIPYVDPNRQQGTGGIVGGALRLGGLAAAGIAGGAALGLGPAAAGAGGIPAAPSSSFLAGANESALGALPGAVSGTAGAVGGGGGLLGLGKLSTGGLVDAAKKYGPLVLGGLGVVNSASQAGKADALRGQALEYAARDYQSRQGARDKAMTMALAPLPTRPDLSAQYASPNPYARPAGR